MITTCSDVASKLVLEMSLSSQAMSNLADKDFYTKQAELRSLAVDKWLCIVRSSGTTHPFTM